MTNALANLGKQWDKDIVQVLQAMTIGRKAMPLNPALSGKGFGMTSVETFIYADRQDAVINYEIQEESPDSIDLTSKTLKIPVQQDDGRVTRRAWEAYILHGTPIENDLALDMAAKVAYQEDKLILNGWVPDGVTYEINGMYQVANNTVNGGDFATYGNALAAVANAIAALRYDRIYSIGYNLFLHPTQYGELLASQSTAGYKEYDQVMALLNINAPGNPGQVFETTVLNDEYGMVAPAATRENMRYFDLVEAQRPVHDLWFETSPKTGPIRVRLVGAIVPRFKHLNSSGKDNCVCTLTTI